MSILQNGEVEPLPLSLETCECYLSNSTQIVDFHQPNNSPTAQ